MPPIVTITSPTQSATLTTSRIEVVGTVNDPTASVEVNDVVASIDGGIFRAPLVLPVGLNTIRAVATDPVGNASQAEIQVTVDATLPVVRITDPVPVGGTIAVSNGTFRLTGTVEPAGTPVDVNGGAAVVAGGTWNADVVFSAGLHELVVTAENGALRAQTTEMLVVDNDGPQVEILFPPEDVLLGLPGYLVPTTSVTFGGRVFDGDGVPRDRDSPPTVTIAGVTADVEGDTFSVTVPLPVIGANLLSLVASDGRGN